MTLHFHHGATRRSMAFVAGLFMLCSVTANPSPKKEKASQPSYPINPVPFTKVKVNDAFWTPRLEACRQVTIPIAFQQSQQTGRIENFAKAARRNGQEKPNGIFFDDSDVFKIVEGAAYSLQTFPDKKLEAYTDSLIDLFAAAQEDDGYLYTHRTISPQNPVWELVGTERWVNVERGSHELYNQGHMMEAAVAYWQATGKRKFLDVACRAADCIIRAIGPADDQLKIVPGHEEIELALCKLYLATGERKYLDQAKFFLDWRGRTAWRKEVEQCHLPITEQKTAAGHAVRAGYLYCGIADVAALTGEQQYVSIIDTIWNDIASYRVYLIGGIGSSREGEAFGARYVLPNETAYNETCAAIAFTFLNQRLFLLHGEGKYIDMLERTLYNGLLSGIAMSGDLFFYPNPLTSHGGYARSEWFGCACCPSNLCRFLPSLPGYVYAVKDQTVFANLYLSNQADLTVGGRRIVLSQTTNYPWEGQITLRVEQTAAKDFDLALRIPGWVRNEPIAGNLYHYVDGLTPSYKVLVNNEPVSGEEINGYFHIQRRWKRGDEVRLELDMPVRTVKADEKVKNDRDLVAFERGPIVYCGEEADNPQGVFTYVVPTHPQVVETAHQPLTGYSPSAAPTAQGKQTQSPALTSIKIGAQHLGYAADGTIATSQGALTLIPYFAWDHRGAGQMKVWFPQGLREIELKNP